MSDFGVGVEPGEQLSVEWLMQRVGKGTGSRFDDIIAKQKSGKPSASRETYLYELVCERLTGKPSDHYTSKAMLWGLEWESSARMQYEALTGAMVAVPVFKEHPAIERCGVSSDGLVDDDGTIEIKCPTSKTHLITLQNGMDASHMAQVQGGLGAWDRQWSDFISFDPRMPEGLQLYVQRIPRDQAFIDAMEAEIVVFLREVDAMVAKLKGVK